MNTCIFEKNARIHRSHSFLTRLSIFCYPNARQSFYVTLKSLFQFEYVACALIGSKHV